MMPTRSHRLLWQAFAVAAIYFVAIAPTLPWPEISGDSEVLLAQTVLQMKHGGPCWLPMLGDTPRTNKPPLPAWITAAAVGSSTVARLSSTDPAERESAYRRLAFEMRWPALFASCVSLLAVGWTARVLGGRRYVLPSMLICGTLFLFIRFIRVATTDAYLLMFVTLANALCTTAVVRKKFWLGFVGGGAAVGCALMSKGPPALPETIVPVGVFVVCRMLRKGERIGPMLAPMGAGILVMLAVALPWPLSVLQVLPGETSNWKHQLEGGGSAAVSKDHWYSYVSLLPNLLPWLGFFVVGMFLASLRLKRVAKISFAVLLMVLPIVIFSFFPLRKERYLLPMTAPAAILAAHAVILFRRTLTRYRAVEGSLWLAHWITVSVIALGLPVAEALFLKRADHAHWLSLPVAGLSAAASIALIAIGARANRRSVLPVSTTAACMMLANVIFLYGWSGSVSGMSEMKPIADRFHAAFPGQLIAYYEPPGGDKPVTLDLDIYLDRSVPVVNARPATDGSVAGVIALRDSDSPPPALPGWRLWDELTTDKHHYHWYLLVPANR